MSGIANKIKVFDAYPKTVEDFRTRTTSGSIVSIISILFTLWLVYSEVISHMSVNVTPEISVDSMINEKLNIRFDIKFSHLPCSILSLNAIDASGNNHLNIVADVKKVRIDAKGNPILQTNKKPAIERDPDYCGDCYGAEDDKRKCCNTCQQVQDQYLKKGWAFKPEDVIQCQEEGYLEDLKSKENEGCRIHGNLMVNKVQGYFNFAANTILMSDSPSLKSKQFDLSHTINKLSFGADFPGKVNPLDRVRKRWSSGKTGAFQYYLKIVPTMYEDSSGNQILSSQYSATDYEQSILSMSYNTMPGVYFSYDFAPMMIKLTETKKSFSEFLISLCTIIGGVFTIASMIDSFIYSRMSSLKKKLEIGKDR